MANRGNGYNPTAVGRHWAVPGKIAEELGLDNTLTVQQKLDAIDEAGFIDHPAKRSSAMPTYRQYLNDSPGMRLQDMWAYQPHTRGVLYETEEGIDEDVRWLVKQGDPERLGYQTQKPEGLLVRIISFSCPPGGIVLDPFCGCGTAIVVAQRLKRPWIGIDITQAAIVVIKQRLRDSFQDRVDFDVVGEPVSLPDAKALATQNPYQFQWWALGLVDARPVEEKRGPDRGIDGRFYFHDDPKSGKTKQIVFSVKAGANVAVTHVRDLRGVVEREKAELGVLLTMEQPTKAMRKEAAGSGFYKSPFGKHPRIQILTIADLLGGKTIDCPPYKVDKTFRKAQRAKSKEPKTLSLPLHKE